MPLANFCNRSTTRAPTDRSIPRRLAYTEPTAYRADTCSERQASVRFPCGNPTPGGNALDGAFQLWANRLQPCPKEGPSTAPGDAASPRCFQPRARLFDPTSDTPFAYPTESGDRILQSMKSLSTRPLVKKSGFPSPKCLPSTSAPEGTRHRARGLATASRLPALFRPAHACALQG
jgi:hypothetical protein